MGGGEVGGGEVEGGEVGGGEVPWLELVGGHEGPRPDPFCWVELWPPWVPVWLEELGAWDPRPPPALEIPTCGGRVKAVEPGEPVVRDELDEPPRPERRPRWLALGGTGRTITFEVATSGPSRADTRAVPGLRASTHPERTLATLGEEDVHDT